MKFTILLKSEDTPATPLTLLEIDRTDALTAATLGLTLAESKQLLARVQEEIVEAQIHLYTQEQGAQGLPLRLLQEPVRAGTSPDSTSLWVQLRGQAYSRPNGPD